MSDDFGTVNLSRDDRAREIEVMRQHFLRHREALVNLAADAPTEHLAGEYRRLIRELDTSVEKVDELEGAPPLVRAELPPVEDEPRSRVAIIVVVAVIALALIGWLIWRASSDRVPEETSTAVVEEPATTTTQAPPPPAPTLSISPPTNDYGVIRKGTRATRQFEITNHTEEPVSIAIARSACRCLFYEHAEVVPPKGKESITVTVDGARAEAGELRETIRITSKSDPAVGTSLDLIATIR
jgi:hypothetical protein